MKLLVTVQFKVWLEDKWQVKKVSKVLENWQGLEELVADVVLNGYLDVGPYKIGQENIKSLSVMKIVQSREVQ